MALPLVQAQPMGVVSLVSCEPTSWTRLTSAPGGIPDTRGV